jgi:fructosamine-3-kinase
VFQDLDKLFEGITVTPSVLHGDLWSGNMASVDGKPAVFDPATYFGHSEADFGALTSNASVRDACSLLCIVTCSGI